MASRWSAPHAGREKGFFLELGSAGEAASEQQMMVDGGRYLEGALPAGPFLSAGSFIVAPVVSFSAVSGLPACASCPGASDDSEGADCLVGGDFPGIPLS